MLASLAPGTLKQYGCSYKRWWEYCQKKNNDVYVTNIPQVIGFLTECFSNGSNYSTLNTHRSALSLLINSKIGNDENISRFLKGAYRQRPVIPKYTQTWDPEIVLNLLNKWTTAELGFKKLSMKLVTLLALTTAHRTQTLASIKMTDIHFSSDRITILVSDLLKTSVATKTPTVLNLPYFKTQSICPAKTLIAYIQRSSEIRGDNLYLILTSQKPFKRASSQTISRWIKEVLMESGIDTSIFSSHSTRHAATSKAKALGVSLDVIRKTAGWTNKSKVFAKHYDLPINEYMNETLLAQSILE